MASSPAKVAQPSKENASLPVWHILDVLRAALGLGSQSKEGASEPRLRLAGEEAITHREIRDLGTHTATVEDLISTSAERLGSSEQPRCSTAGVKSTRHTRRAAKPPAESGDRGFCAWDCTGGRSLGHCDPFTLK